jgi:hypothetical protein
MTLWTYSLLDYPLHSQGVEQEAEELWILCAFNNFHLGSYNLVSWLLFILDAGSEMQGKE